MKHIPVVALVFSICLTLPTEGYAQTDASSAEHELNKATTKTVCYASFKNEHTFLPPPASYGRLNKQAKTNSSSFVVDYVNFPTEAEEAFQMAVDIWATILESPVTIRIKAIWEPLGTGVLGAASPGDYVRNFEGAQKRNIWYPVALAEKMTGLELNSTTGADIEATFNSNYSSWYFGTDGVPPAGKFDFLTIVLHEIGHGLGITHAYTVVGSNGTISNFFNNNPVVFESFVENGLASRLVTNYVSPSPELKEQLIGSNLFFNGPNVLAQNANIKAKIYAPANYSSGSSIAHVDELTYPAGDQNSLMTPQIGFAEAIHNPGPIVIGMLKDMGWSGTYIRHSKVNNSEDVNTPFPIVANIASEVTYDENSLKLYHRTEGQEFTSLSMSTTGIPNEFSANIPATGVPSNYEYYIGVVNNFAEEITNQGKVFNQGQPITQGFFRFETGPDTEVPIIQHQPKPFVLAGDTELLIEANISDNIALQKADIEYFINDVSQGIFNMTLVDADDSLYNITINYPSALSLNDKVKYRIIATDNAVAQNVSNFPTTGYIELNAEGFSPTQDFYVNDFNDMSAAADFFGDALFSIKTESGFENGAIHTSHPYPNGIGSELESEFIYQLKVPIRLKEGQASLKFDEIVLVEPGDGAPFGSVDFFDYLIVEGSNDGGVQWFPFADGYDSSDKPEWLSHFESSNDSETPPNSAAIGDPSLYRTRIIDMLSNGNFEANDEIVIRFRLFVDAFVHGWGWAIDNLKIQIDETPPQIQHDQIDYILSNEPLILNMAVTDINGVQSISIDYSRNDEATVTVDLLVQPFEDQYAINLDVSDLAPGDELKYAIRTTDQNGNEAIFPATGIFIAPYLDLADTTGFYSNDFNTPSNDFAGNFFLISTPLNFQDAALHSTINYPVGFGLENASTFFCILKKSILVNGDNPVITFDEIALLDPNDHMIVEASKDKGQSWIPLTEKYNSQSQSAWTGAWLNNRNADLTMYQKRTINLLDAEEIKENDTILIRFKLFSNKTISGWGWAIDNLSIQPPVTATESELVTEFFHVYPNPAKNTLTIELNKSSAHAGDVSIMDLNGKVYKQLKFDQTLAKIEETLQVSDWPNGMYIAKAKVGPQIAFVKVMIQH